MKDKWAVLTGLIPWADNPFCIPTNPHHPTPTQQSSTPSQGERTWSTVTYNLDYQLCWWACKSVTEILTPPQRVPSHPEQTSKPRVPESRITSPPRCQNKS
ncbi:hypothetical protein ATANTOWER_012228, partial [Ataeniobius toweri]|nr:hypothetical protein [Ataeniobius toweri]